MIIINNVCIDRSTEWKTGIHAKFIILLKYRNYYYYSWFERFVNQWCLINVQEMHFANWSIICANFGPLNCISKLRFQILTPLGIKLICWLWLSSFCRDIHFQKTGYLSAIRHKIKIAYFGSEKTDIEYTCGVSFFFFFFFFFVQYIDYIGP